MLAVNLFGFGTNPVELQTESVAVEQDVNVENVSQELISSGSGEFLLFSVLLFSVFFTFFVKRFS